VGASLQPGAKAGAKVVLMFVGMQNILCVGTYHPAAHRTALAGGAALPTSRSGGVTLVHGILRKTSSSNRICPWRMSLLS
jgi:hypothetical protein